MRDRPSRAPASAVCVRVAWYEREPRKGSMHQEFHERDAAGKASPKTVVVA